MLWSTTVVYAGLTPATAASNTYTHASEPVLLTPRTRMNGPAGAFDCERAEAAGSGIVVPLVVVAAFAGGCAVDVVNSKPVCARPTRSGAEPKVPTACRSDASVVTFAGLLARAILSLLTGVQLAELDPRVVTDGGCVGAADMLGTVVLLVTAFASLHARLVQATPLLLGTAGGRNSDHEVPLLVVVNNAPVLSAA